MSRGKRIILAFSLVILLIAVSAVFATWYLYQFYYLAGLQQPLDPEGKPQRFVVRYGESVDTVIGNLDAAGLIADPRLLKIFARLNPDRASVKAGEYEVSAAMSPGEILATLVSGKVITYSVTFPEGLTLTEMAAIWESTGFGTQPDFLEAVNTYTDADLETPPTGWEGYLYPETYVFTAEFNEKKLVAAMIDQFKTVMRPEWKAAAREHGFTLHDIVTLASLIEKETRIPEERPRVSAVFHNRLRKGMLLQCDPTVIYALGDRYKGRLLKKHLAMELPYNTYVYPGLPPGPIAAPGAGSLAAACFPADTDDLYFVADLTGGHRFSRTLTEHNRAVRAYRRGLRNGKND